MNTKTKRRLKAVLAVLTVYGVMTSLALLINSIPDGWWPNILLALIVIGATCFMYYAALDIITTKEEEKDNWKKYKDDYRDNYK
jgi:hypothetical protein